MSIIDIGLDKLPQLHTEAEKKMELEKRLKELRAEQIVIFYIKKYDVVH